MDGFFSCQWIPSLLFSPKIQISTQDDVWWHRFQKLSFSGIRCPGHRTKGSQQNELEFLLSSGTKYAEALHRKGKCRFQKWSFFVERYVSPWCVLQHMGTGLSMNTWSAVWVWIQPENTLHSSKDSWVRYGTIHAPASNQQMWLFHPKDKGTIQIVLSFKLQYARYL